MRPCPVCAGRIGWKALVRSPGWPFAFPCPTCGARLRMADPWLFIEAAIVGVIPAAVFIILASHRGWLDSSTATAVIAAVACLAAGGTIVWWLGRRAEWTVRGDAAPASVRGYTIAVALNLLLGTAVIAGAAFALLTMAGLARGPQVSFPPAATAVPLAAVDPDWTVQSLEGEELSLADLRGRTLFVNFWATWCPPCRAEMPGIQTLYNSLEGEGGVAFLLVSNEPASVVAGFIAESGYTFPVYIATEPPPDVLASDSIPATFILNGDGDVVFVHVGMADWNTDECREFLRELP